VPQLYKLLERLPSLAFLVSQHRQTVPNIAVVVHLLVARRGETHGMIGRGRGERGGGGEGDRRRGGEGEGGERAQRKEDGET